MQFFTIDAAFAATILTFVSYTDAFWRMECHFDSGLARIDPLVSPGVPSSHMHSVFGSSGEWPIPKLSDRVVVGPHRARACDFIHTKFYDLL
jgi:hypothetical protein